VAYNHYAMLRSVEDLFGVGHLGFAATAGLAPFGPDVYNGPGPVGAVAAAGSGSTSPARAAAAASPRPRSGVNSPAKQRAIYSRLAGGRLSTGVGWWATLLACRDACADRRREPARGRGLAWQSCSSP